MKLNELQNAWVRYRGEAHVTTEQMQAISWAWQQLQQEQSHEDLNKIVDLVTARTLFTTKEVLTSEETALYLGISKSYLYKLTMKREIPHYKPMGKMCYFNRHEVEAWLQSNRVASDTELTSQAAAYCSNHAVASAKGCEQ